MTMFVLCTVVMSCET